MVLVQSERHIISDPSVGSTVRRIRTHLEKEQRLGLFLYGEGDIDTLWGTMEYLIHTDHREEGQYLRLDVEEFQDDISLPDILRSTLEDWHGDQPFRIHLPVILRNNPKTDSPFISRAVLWQRLCDRLIEDEDAFRPTLLVLEDMSQATPQTLHAFQRLLRFHQAHNIRRTFLLPMREEDRDQLDADIMQYVNFEIRL